MAVALQSAPHWVAVWGTPSDALDKVSAQIDYFEASTDSLRWQVRELAHENIDLLLAAPVSRDLKIRLADIGKRFESVLDAFLTETSDPDLSLNPLWEELDQSVSFYLLDAGHDSHIDPVDLHGLRHKMTQERDRLPGLIAEVSNLADAVKASAGYLPQVQEAAAKASDKLDRTKGELKMGAGILTRQIGMANYSHRQLLAKSA